MALFPLLRKQSVGALYFDEASGKCMDSASEKDSRVVYFESSNPDNLHMRVSKTPSGEARVLFYTWDRSEHALKHRHTSPEPLVRGNSGIYVLYIHKS